MQCKVQDILANEISDTFIHAAGKSCLFLKFREEKVFVKWQY